MWKLQYGSHSSHEDLVLLVVLESWYHDYKCSTSSMDKNTTTRDLLCFQTKYFRALYEH